ncbi:hypothetical protein HGRIS_002269 [Hohenbuehelia grisea]|uniref:DNA repair and recombination protein RAD54B n=1 Tax=Hohenbuehelia grisea TaxID=104357 RepID=A0ABR3JK37_9AGAR
MPPFLAPASGLKRKSDVEDDSSRKRSSLSGGSSHSNEEYWMLQWRLPQSRKHKTWDGDAVMVLSSSKATVFDMDEKQMTSGRLSQDISVGSFFVLGNKEFEVDRAIPRGDYLSGACFGRAPATSVRQAYAPRHTAKQFMPPTLKVPNATVHPLTANVLASERPQVPLQPVNLYSTTNNTASGHSDTAGRSSACHWTANWRKPSQKKNKTWDGDAYISLQGSKLLMVSEDGKIMASTAWKDGPLYAGQSLRLGNKEVELDCEVSFDQLPTISGGSHSLASNEEDDQPTVVSAASPIHALAAKKFVAPASFYAPPPKQKVKPRHDPMAEGAFVMKEPSKEHEARHNKKGHPVLPVVLDPMLARHMRPHQKEGFQFLYECVMGMRKHEGNGCILADEMGLGKTLQTISLVWTLLKQNPYATGEPVVKNVLIVCPVSLINNWKAEFHKWLGRDRVGVVTCDKHKQVVKTFMNTKTQQVLIIGYERLRTVIDDLRMCIPPIGLIICDEGHRLKSAKNKTVEALNLLKTSRRIILSGTPIQNDLGEFHTMADFCNPGLLDSYGTFRRVYETPILKSRAPDCTAKEREIGQGRSEQLLSVAKSFVLRREATLLKNYLPPKHEYVVFITPTKLQLSIFQKVLNPEKLDSLIEGSTADSLALINILTKISSSPILLKASADKARDKLGANNNSLRKSGALDALKLLPERAEIEDMTLSGKLTALSNMLKTIRSTTEEKVVLVSHYTSTLNILEAFCKKQRYSYFRLDGQTPAAKRQEYVNDFNKTDHRQAFVFLLSSKAGGVGINLIGASRLCLVDSDWNPSHDLQSMARIHRDGQRRPVHIYRFLTAGTIDEKIYQRQVTKLGLSNAMIGTGKEDSKSDSFTRKDLRDIFRIHPDTPCNTHELLQCPCGLMEESNDEDEANSRSSESSGVPMEDDESEGGRGFVHASTVQADQLNRWDKEFLREKKRGLAALGEWRHIDCLKSAAVNEVHDEILRRLLFVRERAEDDRQERSDKTRLDRLLSATDLDTVAAMEGESKPLMVSDVPGGTISFIFQKSSLTVEDASENLELESS